jgi:hypothetical protein
MKLHIRPVPLVALAALVLGSCSQPTKVVVLEEQPPAASTPQSAVKAFEWAVARRNIEVLERLFTEDFVFVGAGLDSAGNPTRDVLYRRDDLLAAFRCMFEGGGEHPPAPRITLSIDRNLIPLPDPRPGYVDSLFKTVRTSVDLIVDIGDGTTLETTGYALFFLVRGDAAAIPVELRDRFKPDRARWWISRWEDESIAYAGAPRHATTPAKNVTFGGILRLFDCAP